MAASSLLQRLNVPAQQEERSSGPTRAKSQPSSRSNAPYSRKSVPKGDIDSQWSHDLFEGGNSLSSRLSTQPIGAPRMNISNIAQKAIREATNGHVEPLSIKGAGSATQANVVEVSGLVAGTTAEDVAAIFKQCGTIMSSDTVSRSPQDPKIRITFKIPASATTAVQKFNGQTADGKVLSVRIIGISGTSTSLVGRLGGLDGLDLVREEQSVDILLTSGDMPTSKMRSDSLINADPRAQVLVAPPGTDLKDYLQQSNFHGQRHARGRGRGGKRGGQLRGGAGGGMEID